MIATKAKNNLIKVLLALVVAGAWACLWVLLGARGELLVAQLGVAAVLFLSVLRGWRLIVAALGLGMLGVLLGEESKVVGVESGRVLFGAALSAIPSMVVCGAAWATAAWLAGRTRPWSRESPLLLKLFSLEFILPPMAVGLRLFFDRFDVHPRASVAAGVFYAAFFSIALVPAWYRLLLLLFDRAAGGTAVEMKRWNYITAWPRVFCERHRLRPARAKNSLLYHDVLCRGQECPQELVTGVEKVVGFIGGRGRGGRADEGGVYRVPVWDEAACNSTNADIDLLEINEDPDVTNYDRAIGDLLNELKNDLSRPRGWLRGIPVVIRGKPAIGDGAMNMLRAEFASVTVENG